MSILLSDPLYQRILSELPEGDLRNELLSQGRRSNAERVTYVPVPERTAAHFRHALRIGATTAMMCGAPKAVVKEMRDAEKSVEDSLLSCHKHFLHDSDFEKVLDMLVHGGGRAEIKASWGEKSLVIRLPNGRDFEPTMSVGYARKLASEIVEEMAAQLNDFAERNAIRPDDVSNDEAGPDL